MVVGDEGDGAAALAWGVLEDNGAGLRDGEGGGGQDSVEGVEFGRSLVVVFGEVDGFGEPGGGDAGGDEDIPGVAGFEGFGDGGGEVFGSCTEDAGVVVDEAAGEEVEKGFLGEGALVEVGGGGFRWGGVGGGGGRGIGGADGFEDGFAGGHVGPWLGLGREANQSRKVWLGIGWRSLDWVQPPSRPGSQLIQRWLCGSLRARGDIAKRPRRWAARKRRSLRKVWLMSFMARASGA